VGGFGSHVLHLLATQGQLDQGLKVRCLTLPDRYLDQDTPTRLYAQAGLDHTSIVTQVFQALGTETMVRARA
ncbi:MAG TPA: 1-deoxy-D-xylulose-5-phosphate synthase, partial [Beijerinckiaceae bacterium]